MSSIRRSKIFQSSSDGDLGKMDQLKPIESLVAKWQQGDISSPPPRIEAERGGGKIFYIEFPTTTTKEESINGLFLKACKYCKKDIAEKEDVYMYGSLQAFCSIKCRRKQITLDQPRFKFDDIGSVTMIGTAAKKFPPLNSKLFVPN